ncbi:MAG: DUF1328 domain-containing protein [Salinisphaera sp.]|nr:DUF1328 domain-containing protein [Salinisphaera sp.]
MIGWAGLFLTIAVASGLLAFGGITTVAVSFVKLVFFLAVILFALSMLGHLMRPSPPG